jgi:hypothetical protein
MAVVVTVLHDERNVGDAEGAGAVNTNRYSMCMQVL